MQPETKQELGVSEPTTRFIMQQIRPETRGRNPWQPAAGSPEMMKRNYALCMENMQCQQARSCQDQAPLHVKMRRQTPPLLRPSSLQRPQLYY